MATGRQDDDDDDSPLTTLQTPSTLGTRRTASRGRCASDNSVLGTDIRFEGRVAKSAILGVTSALGSGVLSNAGNQLVCLSTMTWKIDAYSHGDDLCVSICV